MTRKQWAQTVIIAALYVVLGGLFMLVGETAYVQVSATVAAIVTWAFVLLYGAGSPWRSTAVGRSLMYAGLALAVVLTLICTSFIFGDYQARPLVRFAVYTSLPLALGRFLVVLRRVQRGRERGEIPAHRVEGSL